jgi:hypothetical protein
MHTLTRTLTHAALLTHTHSLTLAHSLTLNLTTHGVKVSDFRQLYMPLFTQFARSHLS